MTSYLQTDPKWRYENYYNGFSFGKFGCLVTSIAMLCDMEPPLVASIITNCFDDQGLLNSACAAEKLDLEYNGVSKTQPDYPCIAETTYFSPGTPQHFFVIFPNGDQWDPLGKNIKYPIKSYRLFKGKENIMSNWTPPDRNFIVSILKNFLTRFYDDYLDYPLDDTRKKIIEDEANKIADDNINIAGFMYGVEEEFSKVYMKKSECILPPQDCSKEIATKQKEWEKESIAEMAEHEKTLKLLNDKMLDMQVKLDSKPTVEKIEVCNGKEVKKIIWKVYLIK